VGKVEKEEILECKKEFWNNGKMRNFRAQKRRMVIKEKGNGRVKKFWNG